MPGAEQVMVAAFTQQAPDLAGSVVMVGGEANGPRDVPADRTPTALELQDPGILF